MARRTGAQNAAVAEAGSRLTFRVGDRRLALNAHEVAEVIRRPRITRVPHAPPSMVGVINLRGAVAPVVSLARLLGDEASASTGGRVIMLDRSPAVGVLVDEVSALADTGEALAPGQLFLDDEGHGRSLDLDALLEQEFAAASSTGVKRAAKRVEQATPVAAAPETALLAFKLAGQDYALPLDHVREAMAVPPEVMTMPRTDAAMAGVVASRGALLPLVFARVLLGLKDRALQGDERVIVTTIGDNAIGLVVDRLSAILRARNDHTGATPPVLNRGRGEAQIEAIYRLPDGRGLVSILSPTRLFEDESVARLLEDGRQNSEAAMVDTKSAAVAERTERFVIFRLGDEDYGLPVGAVEEIVRMPDQLTRVPKAPKFVEGVMNLRGRVVPVIDQRDRFQAPAATASGRRRAALS